MTNLKEDVHFVERGKNQDDLPEGFMDLVKAVAILLKIDRRLHPQDYETEESTKAPSCEM
jgi:hypothetical protein